MHNINGQIAEFKSNFQAMDTLYKEHAKANGIPYMSYSVLWWLYTVPDNCTQKMICEKSAFPKQTVNIIIKSFWKQGYVKLTEIATDRRNKQIKLTKAGLDYAESIFEKSCKAETAAWNTLTPEQRQTMVDILGIYRTALTNAFNND